MPKLIQQLVKLWGIALSLLPKKPHFSQGKGVFFLNLQDSKINTKLFVQFIQVEIPFLFNDFFDIFTTQFIFQHFLCSTLRLMHSLKPLISSCSLLKKMTKYIKFIIIIVSKIDKIYNLLFHCLRWQYKTTLFMPTLPQVFKSFYDINTSLAN